MAMMNTGTEDAELSSFEKDCIRKVETQVDLEEGMSSGKDDASHRLWQSFQDSASAASKFYLAFTDQTRGVPEALSGTLFHEAACSITKLYSEAGDVCSRGIDLGIDYGSQKRTKEILSWLKKKKKYIRRDELIAFLSGEPCLTDNTSFVHHQLPSPILQSQAQESAGGGGRSAFRHGPLATPYHSGEYAPSHSQAMSTLQCNPSRMVPDIPTPPTRHHGFSPRRNTALKLGDANQFFKDICIGQTRKRGHSVSYPSEMMLDCPMAKREKQPLDNFSPPP